MIEPSTEQMIEVVRRLRQLHPEWRVGQLVANIAIAARGPTESAVWDVEDSEFMTAAEEHLNFNASVSEATTR